MSPYTRDVVDASLADYDYGAGQTRAQQALDLAKAGAFGGSGAALTRSMTEDSLVRGRALASASLRDQAFNRGATLSSEDAARRQAASEANANFALQVQQRNLAAAAQLGVLDNQRSINARADAATIAGIGDVYRTIDTEHRQAPLSVLGAAANMWGNLPVSLFIGQSEVGSSKSNTSNVGLGFEFKSA
jgi:hypothetical protein